MTEAAAKPVRAQRPKRKRIDHEGPVHIAVLNRLRVELPSALIHHAANELGLSGISAMRSRKKALRMGMQKGWPDIEVLLPGGVALFFEIKAPAAPGRRAGKESTDQEELRLAAQAMGHRWAVVRSQDDAVAALDAWGIPRRSGGRA